MFKWISIKIKYEIKFKFKLMRIQAIFAQRFAYFCYQEYFQWRYFSFSLIPLCQDRRRDRGDRGWESAKMSRNFILVIFTFRALGCLWANLYKSSEARCVLLKTKSNDGPISSSSIRGVRHPDFFNRHLQLHNIQISIIVGENETEWMVYTKILFLVSKKH